MKGQFEWEVLSYGRQLYLQEKKNHFLNLSQQVITLCLHRCSDLPEVFGITEDKDIGGCSDVR